MHNPEFVLKNDRHKLDLDFDLQTHHLISARKPEIMMIKKDHTDL